MWLLLAIIVVLAVLAGYLIGARPQQQAAPAAAPAASASSAPQAPTATAAGAGNGEGAVSLTQPKGAHMFGPGAPIRTADDVENVHRRNPEDPFALGKVDAPVVISEFSDFECPFCSRYANTVEDFIVEEYVNKGLVRIEWNDMPINGPAAVAAAQAGRAAAAQGKFFEFKKALYTASKDVQGHPNYGIEDFVGFARTAGVADLERFRKEATDGTYADSVNKARQYGSGIGVNGTPSFFVGGSYFSGAQPKEAFIKVIEAELAKKGR